MIITEKERQYNLRKSREHILLEMEDEQNIDTYAELSHRLEDIELELAEFTV